jgi:hypothetical protein
MKTGSRENTGAVRSTYFHFVAHFAVSAMRAKGWRLVHDLQDCHHGGHAVLMIWEGECEPD